ncbi:16S rRNA (guanine(527)-N(7))-methyltransferase RsmG [soil metagenome]
MNVPVDSSNIGGVDVSRETFEILERIVALIQEESQNQNLISKTTVDDIWDRHIVDSVQLIKFAGTGNWLDLGTGAGFPGLVVAAFKLGEVTLVEERRLRHEFLSRAVAALGLNNVTVVGDKIERVPMAAFQTISARAFAPLDKILTLSHRFSNKKTRWILPKGRKADEELESIQRTWHGDFRLEPSVTDPTSSIIIAENVAPRGRR